MPLRPSCRRQRHANLTRTAILNAAYTTARFQQKVMKNFRDIAMTC